LSICDIRSESDWLNVQPYVSIKIRTTMKSTCEFTTSTESGY